MSWSFDDRCDKTCMTYTSAECTVETPDDGQRNCPKLVEFLDKNKLGKISASLGFIKKNGV
jgi:hypothetical protein